MTDKTPRNTLPVFGDDYTYTLHPAAVGAAGVNGAIIINLVQRLTAEQRFQNNDELWAIISPAQWCELLPWLTYQEIDDLLRQLMRARLFVTSFEIRNPGESICRIDHDQLAQWVKK